LGELDESISPDLAQRLKVSQSELSQFVSHLERLRDRPSQKMSENLDSCIAELETIVESIAAVELEAGLRSGQWFSDYSARTESQDVVA
jgi:hypothetical protein